MRPLRTLPILAGILASTAAVLPAADAPAKPKETFWIIPHTHWEGAVFKTREEYLAMGLPNILKALHLLKTQPSYRFVLDQVAYVRPFLERYPECEADFRRFVAEGRLQLVLGMDIMPDVNMPGGETFVRQMQYGKRYYRDTLGVDVTCGWLADTFGHHAQMPQLLAKAGYRSFWFSRGVPRPDHPSEFLWEGIDGTRIPAFWMPFSYGLMYGAPKDLAGFRGFAKGRFDMLKANSLGPDRAGPSGVDVGEPEGHLAPLVAQLDALPDAPFALRMAVPAEFEAVVAKRSERPVFRGELNPIFQGTYSSRIELKGWMRTMERLLTAAEKLDVIGRLLGAPGDDRALWRAWEPVLFNETHDLASGVMTDHVYDDTLRSYEFSRRLADERIDDGWNALTSRIDTRGDGAPVVVFNPLAWTRSDVAEVDLGFDDAGVEGVALADAQGRPVPVQVLDSTRYPGGGLKTARVAFLARDIPSLGYSTFRAKPAPAAPPRAEKPDALENDLYRLTFDPATGAMTSLLAKADNWEVFSGHANVVARQQDRGDLWELYRGLDGGSKIAMTNRQPVPKPGDATVLSDAYRGGPGEVRGGPVFSEFRVKHAFDSGSFATAVRLYHGLRRIDVATTLVNNEKFVRYQALFPTTIRGGTSHHEIPFGAIERPAGIEFPAQNWVDHGDGRRGLALLNVGLPGNVVTDGTMMISLLRSHNLGGYGFGGGYEPGMACETGFELGRERTLRYALVPHAGDWRDAAVYRDALELNHPLLARKVAVHAGTLPGRWGLLDVSHPGLVVSSLKPGRDGRAVLRVYEATGRAVSGAKLAFHAGLAGAAETNLLEDPAGEVGHEGDAITLDWKPYEIRTIALKLAPPPARP